MKPINAPANIARIMVMGYGIKAIRFKGKGRIVASRVNAMKYAAIPNRAACPKFNSPARPNCKSKDIASRAKIII
jgi:hypothetical protein